MTLKDLKTTYNTLSELDYPVPTELLVHLADRIRTQETTTRQRRLSRMTEEQLIRLESKQKRALRIYLPDGRMICKPSTLATYREAIREIGAERISPLHLKLGRKEVIRYDATLKRKRYHKHYFLQPGYFLYDAANTTERYTVLIRIDQLLHLDWEIELL